MAEITAFIKPLKSVKRVFRVVRAAKDMLGINNEIANNIFDTLLFFILF
jgi:hypothetical protein